MGVFRLFTVNVIIDVRNKCAIFTYCFFLFLCSIFFFLPPKTKELSFDLSILLLPYLLVQTSIVAQLVKNPPAVWETWAQSLGWKIPGRRESLHSPVCWAGEFHGP